MMGRTLIGQKRNFMSYERAKETENPESIRESNIIAALQVYDSAVRTQGTDMFRNTYFFLVKLLPAYKLT